ncbi:hypothetical protein quinque_002418 [Culex quinquefasciatus]
MLKKEYDELKSSTDIDKRFALHQAFRDLLLAKTGDIPAIEKLISFAVAAYNGKQMHRGISIELLKDYNETKSSTDIDRHFAQHQAICDRPGQTAFRRSKHSSRLRLRSVGRK